MATGPPSMCLKRDTSQRAWGPHSHPSDLFFPGLPGSVSGSRRKGSRTLFLTPPQRWCPSCHPCWVEPRDRDSELHKGGCVGCEGQGGRRLPTSALPGCGRPEDAHGQHEGCPERWKVSWIATASRATTVCGKGPSLVHASVPEAGVPKDRLESLGSPRFLDSTPSTGLRPGP